MKTIIFGIGSGAYNIAVKVANTATLRYVIKQIKGVRVDFGKSVFYSLRTNHRLKLTYTPTDGERIVVEDKLSGVRNYGKGK